MLPLLPAFNGAAWFGAWLLDRILREVEDRATSHVRDTTYDCRCMWCGREYAVTRRPDEGPPTMAPPCWLSSRRDGGFYWCSMKCWDEHFRVDVSVGYPAGADWDACLELSDDL